MHKLRKTNRRQAAKPPNSPAQTAAKSKSNATANAANSADPTNAPNAASPDHKRRQTHGHVIVTYKIFPEDIVKDFDAPQERNRNPPPQIRRNHRLRRRTRRIRPRSPPCPNKIPRRRTRHRRRTGNKTGRNQRHQPSSDHDGSPNEAAVNRLVILFLRSNIYIS